MKPEQLIKKKNYLWIVLGLVAPEVLLVLLLNQAVSYWGMSKLFAFSILLFVLAAHFAFVTWAYIQSKNSVA